MTFKKMQKYPPEAFYLKNISSKSSKHSQENTCVRLFSIIQNIAEIFKSTHFKEHLRTTASENVFMKQKN